jgi:large subunit ribosomal protein L22
METVSFAKSKYIKMPVRKIKKVIDLIRGKTYQQALLILIKSTKIASKVIWKVLYSASENAKNLKEIEKTKLLIKEIFVNSAGMRKKKRPRQKGKSFPIRKRQSHLTVKLTDISLYF